MMLHRGGGCSILSSCSKTNINVLIKRPSSKILQPLYPPVEVIFHPITSIFEEIEESAKYDELPENDIIFNKFTTKTNTKKEDNEAINIQESGKKYNYDNVVKIQLSDIQEYPNDNLLVKEYINRLKWDEEIYGIESYSKFCPLEMNSESVKLKNTGNYILQANKATVLDSNCYKKRKTDIDKVIEIIQNNQDWDYEYKDCELMLTFNTILNGPKSKILIRIKENNIKIINSIFPKHGYFYDLVNEQMISDGLTEDTTTLSNFDNIFNQLNMSIKKATNYFQYKSALLFNI